MRVQFVAGLFERQLRRRISKPFARNTFRMNWTSPNSICCSFGLEVFGRWCCSRGVDL